MAATRLQSGPHKFCAPPHPSPHTLSPTLADTPISTLVPLPCPS